jgi:hypothetical protein
MSRNPILSRPYSAHHTTRSDPRTTLLQHHTEPSNRLETIALYEPPFDPARHQFERLKATYVAKVRARLREALVASDVEGHTDVVEGLAVDAEPVGVRPKIWKPWRTYRAWAPGLSLKTPRSIQSIVGSERAHAIAEESRRFPPPIRRWDERTLIPIFTRCDSERSVPPARYRLPTRRSPSRRPHARRHPISAKSVDHRITSRSCPATASKGSNRLYGWE